MADAGIKMIAQNRRARHDYDVKQTIECGIVLAGAEVKSLREGKAQLRESYARVESNEVWVMGLHISPWASATGWGAVDPDRRRKLLLHGKEIDELRRKTEQDSYTLVPLAMYFKDGRAKLELAVAKGRKTYDKRHAIAERDVAREAERDMSAARRRGR